MVPSKHCLSFILIRVMETRSNDRIMSGIKLAQFRLKCQLFKALFQKDGNEDLYQIIKSNVKVSKCMFPMIV